MVVAVVEVNLGEFDTQDSIGELRNRDRLSSLIDTAGIKDVLNYLQDNGCPEEILKQLREWARGPVPTPEKLEEWKSYCGTGSN